MIQPYLNYRLYRTRVTTDADSNPGDHDENHGGGTS